jgi:hypothetical protein
MKRFVAMVTGLVFAVVASHALAQAWPVKPIKSIVPFAPGGTTDILARTIGEKLAVALGQPVIIENKPGAGGGLARISWPIGARMDTRFWAARSAPTPSTRRSTRIFPTIR